MSQSVACYLCCDAQGSHRLCVSCPHARQSPGDGLRQRRPSKSAAKDFADPERIRQMSQKSDMLVPSLIVAVLLGWFIGHFIV